MDSSIERLLDERKNRATILKAGWKENEIEGLYLGLKDIAVVYNLLMQGVVKRSS